MKIDSRHGRRHVGVGSVLAPMLGILLAACGGGGSPSPVSPLTLSPATVTLDAGTSHQFSANGGQPPYSYSVSGGGSIDSAGGTYVAPGAAGVATIRVTDQAGGTAQSSVTVNSGPSIAPSPATLAVGTSLTFAARGGTPPYTLKLASGGGSFDPATGVYTAPGAPGTATITLTDSLSVAAQVTITINPSLSIVPKSITMTASSGQTYKFSGLGGGAGYSYSMASGTGTVDATGLYTAGTSIGRDVVQVRDAQGAATAASVQLVRAQTNGPVEALIVDASGTYLGGAFTAVHPYVTSRVAALDLTSGKPNLGCDLGTGFDSTVRATLLVGNSLYVGGDFSTYKGQPAHGLVKLDAATCALDTAFTQAVMFAGNVLPYAFVPDVTSVYAIASGGSSLYVGGNFSSYRGLPAGGLAKLDLVTGQLDQTFTQATGVDGAITAIAASADSVFIGGTYSHYRGATVGLPNGFPQKLSAVSGDIDPTFSAPSTSGGVPHAIIQYGSSLYVGGNSVPAIEKLDVASGAPDPVFAQNTAMIQGQINSLALSGNSLYLAGRFAGAGGIALQDLAKIDAVSGKADGSFNRASTGNQIVWGVAANAMSVYIVGDFQDYAGHSLPGLAKLDALSGDPDPAFGLATGFTGGSPTLLTASADTLYVAGGMLTYGGIPASSIARLDPITGVADTGFLRAGGPDDGIVGRMLLSGSDLYVGGTFTSYGGVAHGMLVKVDATTGVPSGPFSQGAGFDEMLDATAQSFGGSVTALALGGNSLYVGGFFNSYRGQPVAALAKLDTVSGNLDTVFNQPVGFTGTPGMSGYDPMGVSALSLTAGALYVAGNFTGYRGTTRYLLAKLDPISGALDSQFVPVTSLQLLMPPSPVTFNALVVSGNNVYAGGEVISLPGGQLVNGLTKLDATTGAADVAFTQGAGLTANQGFTASVYDLALSGSSLYVAGNFGRNLTGSSAFAFNLAKLDATTGAADQTFTRSNGPDASVYSLYLNNGTLFINGQFDWYRGSFAGYSIPLDPVTGADQDPQPSPQ